MQTTKKETESGRGGERETERQRQTHRHTDRLTDRQKTSSMAVVVWVYLPPKK